MGWSGQLKRISFQLNEELYSLEVPVNKTLLDLLRKDLGLTGTKCSCHEGECGACTVLLDGRAVPSCLVLVVDVDGKHVVTIEGLGKGEILHPIQEAFVREGAIQCGFCTPGMVMAAKALLDENPEPTSEDVREAISGNLCRCTGYQHIIGAILKAAEELRKDST